MENIVKVDNIHKRYFNKKILKGVSFYANIGECVGIVGANGCGKSTLLNILSGSLAPNKGSIYYNGENPLKDPSVFSDYIGFIPQENPLLNHLSVYDNLKFWYCDSKRNLDADLEFGLPHEFGLTKYIKYDVDKLSGGMKKRLSIACALAKDPEIIIMDEPGASLDIVCKEDIKNYLSTYLARNGTIIITSHEISELSLCDRMYHLHSGILTPIPELSKEARKNDPMGDAKIGDFLNNLIKNS